MSHAVKLNSLAGFQFSLFERKVKPELPLTMFLYAHAILLLSIMYTIAAFFIYNYFDIYRVHSVESIPLKCAFS